MYTKVKYFAQVIYQVEADLGFKPRESNFRTQNYVTGHPLAFPSYLNTCPPFLALKMLSHPLAFTLRSLPTLYRVRNVFPLGAQPSYAFFPQCCIYLLKHYFPSSIIKLFWHRKCILYSSLIPNMMSGTWQDSRNACGMNE